MASNAAKGQQAKMRTKRWLERQGYDVAFMERLNWIFRPGARPIPVKKDQLGCDLMAVNDFRVLFVQVKSFGTTDRRNALTIKAALAEFAKFPCPPGAEQVIVTWQAGVRLPVLTYAPRIGVNSTIDGGIPLNGQRKEGLCQHVAGEAGRDCQTGRPVGTTKGRGTPLDARGSQRRRAQGRHQQRQKSAGVAE